MPRLRKRKPPPPQEAEAALLGQDPPRRPASNSKGWAALKDQGILTEEEFSIQKAKFRRGVARLQLQARQRQHFGQPKNHHTEGHQVEAKAHRTDPKAPGDGD
jgi:hypothetical protein